MARKEKAGAERDLPEISGTWVWLQADYHAHTFHYRMPETVAIAAVSPLIPSPLTVKMALVAALARTGDTDGAQTLASFLPHLRELHIVPPAGVVTFKAFMRYVRPPADPTAQDGNTGGYFAVSPHIREYALWQEHLSVYVKCPVEVQEILEQALWDITYLGAKDSQVTCLRVETLAERPELARCARLVTSSQDLSAASGPIFRYADFAPDRALTLEQIIPFGRDKKDYTDGFYMLPGTLKGSGRAKLYLRKDRANAQRDGDTATANE
jgi:CRISPR-associated protein Cas5 subtype I-A